MDNRYLYRGKRVDNEKWFVGYYSCLYTIDNHEITDSLGYTYQVIPSTIGQCTGFSDVKGNLIYENDTFEKGGNKFKIEWFDGGFIIVNCSDVKKFEVLNVSNIIYYEIEITGNIHDEVKKSTI